MHFLIVNVNQDDSVILQKFSGYFQPISHKRQPTGVVKTIVIAKTITSGVIRRVNIDQFDPPVELLFEGVEGDEVVAFDDEIFADDAVLISLKFTNLIFRILITIYPPPRSVFSCLFSAV